ncbi:MAG: flagellar hook-basal body complex protein FliE [Alphaproteobacteria bacterium]
MDVKAANAAMAYAARLSRPDAAAKSAVETRAANQSDGFAGMVKSALDDTAATLKKSEALTNQALVNPADLGEVVTAVASAEVTLQTVVAVRDRVVQAYQDILRMPI